MATQVANNNGQAKTANTAENKKPKFVAGNPVNAVSQNGQTKPEDNKQPEQVNSPQVQQPKAEPSKLEIKAQLAEQKPALNLEQTLKKIKDLNRLSNQREKLIGTIDNLEGFEILQENEVEETNLNKFQRCELQITDDNGHSFSTKNPFIK